MSDTTTAAKPADIKSETSDKVSAKLPGTPGFDADAAKKALTAEPDSERNEVFTSLVTADADIIGLVAYSIYKQNKHDWLVAFNKLKSREPYDDELQAYIVGESTPRRLATYRHLAEATLDGRGPKVTMGPAAEKFVQRSLVSGHAAQTDSGNRNVVGWVIAAIVALAAILVAGKYGIPGLR